jgi:hypothetical protein
VVLQGRRVTVVREGAGPVIDTLPRYAQSVGDLGDGLAAIEFQDGQQAAVVADFVRIAQLNPKLTPLRGG